MNKLRNSVAVKSVALVATLAMALSFSFGVGVQDTHAQTVAELLAQIEALQAQLLALQGGGTSCPAIAQPLTIGSRGENVVDLQNYLTSTGHFTFSGGSTGYFGPITQSALAAWQAANGVSPAVGYWGPISQAKYNSVCMSSDDGDDGDDDDADDGDDFTLEGGAGSVEDYSLISSLNNEEVGEGENDVEVAGLEVEVDDGSDIMITAVKVDFDQSTGATSDFRKYADEVSIWVDGEKFGERDADRFTDDNSYSQTVTLDRGAIIRADQKGEIVVAVSGLSNIDSSDQGDKWTVDFTQVRFRDGLGASISEDPATSARTFSFESFASAANTKFKIQDGSNSDDVNDARVINVDDSDDTDNVPILNLDVKIEGTSDVELDDLPVTITVGGGASHVDAIVSALDLYVDGDLVGSADMNGIDDGDGVNVGTSEPYLFDDMNLVLEPGTYEFEVRADLDGVSGNYTEGDTVQAAIGETETDLSQFDADDANGDNLADSDVTGTVTGDAHALYDVGIMVDFVSASETAQVDDGADDDTGVFKIKYEVTAFDGTVYVSDSSEATTATSFSGINHGNGGIAYQVDKSGTATTAKLNASVTESGDGTDSGVTNGFKLTDGQTSTFTLTVTRTNDGATLDNGLYRVLLKAIGWHTVDQAAMNAYTFDLSDFKTDPLSLD